MHTNVLCNLECAELSSLLLSHSPAWHTFHPHNSLFLMPPRETLDSSRSSSNVIFSQEMPSRRTQCPFVHRPMAFIYAHMTAPLVIWLRLWLFVYLLILSPASIILPTCKALEDKNHALFIMSYPKHTVACLTFRNSESNDTFSIREDRVLSSHPI
jgi:hypothetical protein